MTGRVRAWGALVLALAYIVPVYWPPAAVPLEPPDAAASLSQRLFPGVPAAWVWLRLAALALSAALLARSVADALPAAPAAAGSLAAPPPVPKIAVWAALLVALVDLTVGIAVPQLGRGAQLTCVAALFVPAVILVAASGRAARSERVGAGALVGIAFVLAAWVLLRVLPAWDSPRVASITDTWLNFAWLLDGAASPRNLLASRRELSASDAWMLLSGVNFLDPQTPHACLKLVLTVGALWLLVGAIAIALLSAETAGWWAALPATASFLFSPLCLFFSLTPAPFALPAALGGVMLWLLWRFYVRGSPAALAGFAAVAGIGATQLHLLHVSVLGMALVLWLAARRRLELVLALLAVTVFLAPTLPSLRELPTLGQLRHEYVSHTWQWAGLEAVLHEQRGVRREPTPEQLMYAGVSAPLDIQIGTLLMPFAVPRTALRLTGDVLFEPISAALAAAGVGAAILRARRDLLCSAALVLLALALLPALAGSHYDRISLTRAMLLPVSLGLFASLAFRGIAAIALPARWDAAAAAFVAALIALSGHALFDTINPKILGTSAMELVLETAGRNGAVALLAGKGVRDIDWLHVERIARSVPDRPLDVVHVAGPEDLAGAPAVAAQAFLWSPGLEEDVGVAKLMCDSMSAARLYEIRSRSGLSRLYAAARPDSQWQPPLPNDRWSARDCGAFTPGAQTGGALTPGASAPGASAPGASAPATITERNAEDR